MILILLRHGESKWNLENRFTGWVDIELTENGIKEAEFAAKQIIKSKIKINNVYTSFLDRAIQTSNIVVESLNLNKEIIFKDWKLNERHYGALQGLNKSDTAKKYGETKVKLWRRSYSLRPPKLSLSDKSHPQYDRKYSIIPNPKPSGESLEDVVKRIKPAWLLIKEKLIENKNILIVAHSNSLRAFIKEIEKLNSKEIVSVEIPTGVPLVYSFDKNFKIFNKKFLINSSLLNKKIDKIKKQGQAN